MEVVIDAVFGRKSEVKEDLTRLFGKVDHPIRARKLDAVGGVPEQPFLAMVEFEIDVYVAGLYEEEMIGRFRFDFRSRLSAFGRLDFRLLGCLVINLRGLLPLRGAPKLPDRAPQSFILRVGSLNHRRA